MGRQNERDMEVLKMLKQGRGVPKAIEARQERRKWITRKKGRRLAKRRRVRRGMHEKLKLSGN